VKCEDSAEFYDLNLDLLLLEEDKDNNNRGEPHQVLDEEALTRVYLVRSPLAGLSVPPPLDPIAALANLGVDPALLATARGASSPQVDAGLLRGPTSAAALSGLGASMRDSLLGLMMLTGERRNDGLDDDDEHASAPSAPVSSVAVGGRRMDDGSDSSSGPSSRSVRRQINADPELTSLERLNAQLRRLNTLEDVDNIDFGVLFGPRRRPGKKNNPSLSRRPSKKPAPQCPTGQQCTGVRTGERTAAEVANLVVKSKAEQKKNSAKKKEGGKSAAAEGAEVEKRLRAAINELVRRTKGKRKADGGPRDMAAQPSAAHLARVPKVAPEFASSAAANEPEWDDSDWLPPFLASEAVVAGEGGHGWTPIKK